MWIPPLLTYRTSEPVIGPPRTRHSPDLPAASCRLDGRLSIQRRGRHASGRLRLVWCSEDVRTRRGTLSTTAKAATPAALRPAGGGRVAGGASSHERSGAATSVRA